MHENRALLQLSSPGPRIRQPFKTPQHFRSLFESELCSWDRVCQTARCDGICAFGDEYRKFEESDVANRVRLSIEFIEQMEKLDLPLVLQVELAIAAVEEITDTVCCPEELIDIAQQAGHRNLIDQCLYFLPTIMVFDPAVGLAVR